VRAVNPLVVPGVFVDPDAIEREQIALREMRGDQADVAFLSDHGMRAIRVTLPGPIIAVRMDVSDYVHLLSSAEIPERHKSCAMKDDDSRVESGRIEVVVADELRDALRTLFAQQESATLPFSTAPTLELSEQTEPEPHRHPQGLIAHGRVD